MSNFESQRHDDIQDQGQFNEPVNSGGPLQYQSAPPPEAGRSSAPVAQLSSIHTAVRLMWAGAAISVLSLVVTLTTTGSLKTQIHDQLDKSGQVTQSRVDAAYVSDQQ